MLDYLAIYDDLRILSRCVTFILLLVSSPEEGRVMALSLSVLLTLICTCDAYLIMREFLMSDCILSAVSSSDLSTLLTYLLTALISVMLLASLVVIYSWIAWLILHFLNMRLAPSVYSSLWPT